MKINVITLIAKISDEEIQILKKYLVIEYVIDLK